MQSITIFITAYQSQDYIEECLDSVQNQDYFKNNDYEILLGIDGCEQTLEKVKQIKHKYKNLTVYYFPENKGTYITSNTLITKAKYNWLLRFDSDDIMEPFMITELMKYTNNYKYIQITCKYLNNENKTMLTGGVILLHKDVFKECNAFSPWTCAADSDLLFRYSINNKQYITECKKPVFKRRVHNNSLTNRKETHRNSSIRKKYWNITTQYIKNKTTKVDLVIHNNYIII